MSRRTQLLVSVRSAEEAVLALEAGVDVVDVKEPRAGSLGAPSPRVAAEIFKLVGERAAISIALGELRDMAAMAQRPSYLQGSSAATLIATLADHAAAPKRFAKVGLAGCANDRDWPMRLSRLFGQLPGGVQSVGVIYADWQTAAAPSPDDVLGVARDLEISVVLVDTFDKRGPGLRGLWSLERIAQVVDDAHQRGIAIALAGQIRLTQIGELAGLGPDYLAVRGAVCHGDRTSGIDPQKITAIRRGLTAARSLISEDVATGPGRE